MTNTNPNTPQHAANDTKPSAADTVHMPKSEEPASPLAFDLNDPTTIKLLRTAVIAMGVILVAGFATVLARIAYLATSQANNSTAPSATPMLATDLPLPPGARVTTLSLSQNRIAVHFESPTGNGIRIINTQTGMTETELTITPQLPSN